MILYGSSVNPFLRITVLNTPFFYPFHTDKTPENNQFVWCYGCMMAKMKV